MKGTIILFLSISVVGCTLSPTEKAKKVIRRYLELSLNDMKSYEVVQFGKLDSSFSEYQRLDQYRKLRDSFDYYAKENKLNLENAKMYAPLSSYSNKASLYLAMAKWDLVKMQSVADSIELASKHFVPKFIGWKMEHSFRAKNLAGNLGIHHYMYYLNPTIDTVVSSLDVGEH